MARRLRNSNPLISLIYVTIIIALLIYGFHYIKQHFNYHLYERKLEAEIIVLIPNGTSIKKIADILLAKQVIADKNVFLAWAKIQQYISHAQLIAGEYKLEKDINMSLIIKKMIAGKVVVHKITIPEGFLTQDAVNTIINAYGVENDLDETSTWHEQGILLPETYFYIYGAKASGIINRAKHALQAVLLKAWPNRNQLSQEVLYSQADALTLASIIERESRLDSEKKRIAAVYVNRLKINMLLQADPTVIYAVTNGQTFDFKLTYEDLKYNSPYNTYITVGLPPAPICNPGKAAIEAALSPIETKEIYFVADGNGGHNFATSFKEHSNNVQHYRNGR